MAFHWHTSLLWGTINFRYGDGFTLEISFCNLFIVLESRRFKDLSCDK